MDVIWGFSHIFGNTQMGYSLWNNPLILTIDPNFQQDIQATPPTPPEIPPGPLRCKRRGTTSHVRRPSAKVRINIRETVKRSEGKPARIISLTKNAPKLHFFGGVSKFLSFSGLFCYHHFWKG